MKAWYDDIDAATLQRIKTYSAFNDAESKNLMIQTMYEYREKEIAELEKENAELKAIVSKWHKVADGDLPKETKFIESDVLLLLVQLKGTERKRYELGRYIFSENVFSYTHLKSIEDVVAWCEIPRFEEE